MKGYLTVFLAMSLSILTGFILLLTGSAVKNAEKVRFECAVDTGMNAVLSEFHTLLLERYGLIYVDASYLGRQPSISNVEDRLRFYVEENTSRILKGANAPWGHLSGVKAELSSIETAAAQMGASMRNQAIYYIRDRGISGREKEAFSQMEEIQILNKSNPFEGWIQIMDQLSGMELPVILTEKGLWEEVPLSNPADWVYEISENDILYMSQADFQSVSPVHIFLEEYISHRTISNTKAEGRIFEQGEEEFLSYLYEQMGYLGNVRENSLLSCQLEYIVGGKDSDFENVKTVAEKLFHWRFADNVLCAFGDGDLTAQAVTAAEELLAVQLKKEFREPVTKSILYACAFIESIGDLRIIYSGGAVPVRKSSHQMSVSHVLNGDLYSAGSGDGFSYDQYLACMILLENEINVNLRVMDIMEMDIRFQDGNKYFAMDWCIERYEAKVFAKGSRGDTYSLRRKYGYF